MGPEGLRAGWGALLFLVLAGVLQIPVVIGLGLLDVHQSDLVRDATSPRGVALSVSLGLFGVVVAMVLMARLERRTAAAYGLGLSRSLLRFTQGALVGLLLMSALAGLLVLSGALVLDGVALQGVAAWHAGLAWAGAYLLVALFEELTTRGYLLQALGRGLGFRQAAVLTSAIFASGHLTNVGEGYIGLAAVMLIGLVLSYSVWRLGSLWWAIGFHAAWNWAQSFLFGVANSGFAGDGHLLTTHPTGPAWLSGGATGPEGSLWNLLIIGVAGLAVYVTARTPRRQATASG
ncbi:CPBP family intramembrane glutamic endopeptidase [Pyxidicoccus caerfyrddinensis]|uniref:CPBP family intramembrane glutamic endopeptidase n=1 Tax=Pyxidicoccus caerfyrddinensis TaxID=2709663 RepID=UPI0013DA2FD4|nr:CPBP family intramembrane glutamic endopeptidase [Pyxidicoccus caerfyrddinensis]